MARRNPVPQEKVEEGRCVRAMRETLKISRTDFSAMCGMSYQLLDAKEAGKVPFRPDELLRIKQVVETHAVKCLTAARALPF